MGISKRELHTLLEDKDLNDIPILVLGNKTDIKPHLNEKEIMEGLNLDYLSSNPWAIMMISAKNGDNIGPVVEWLVKESKK